MQRYTMFAAYNQWANARLYGAASALSDTEYRADRGAFFKSVHGTLNQLLATDRMWMKRMTGQGDAPDRLDAILFEDFAQLQAARETEDQRLLDFVATLDDAALAAPLRYRTITNPAEFQQPLSTALDHVFNHQTHHRGQAHCLLTILVRAAPSLDLAAYQREVGLSRATGA